VIREASGLRFPLQGRALSRTLAASGVAFLGAGLAGVVRLSPWLLDPAVTFRLALPFARGLLALAAEASLLLGWPVGWALATASLVERGEARALATLGESPARALVRLGPQAAGLAALLGLVSFLGARDASEPGRVISELIERGRETCAEAAEPTTYSVPFASVTWLCAPGIRPRLVGHGPGGLGHAMFTAARASAGGDLREIRLDDAHLALGAARVHVGSLVLRGLSPFARASSVPPAARAIALSLAGLLAAAASVIALLRGTLRGTGGPIVVAAAGALAALGAMRSADRADAGWAGALLVPGVGLAASFLTIAALSGLPRRMRAASKGIDHG
jgi:hypothetical protein